MSLVEGQTLSLAQGPLRPIPIHLPPPPASLDTLNFRLPLPLSVDKPSKPNPPLWNPALDLRTPSTESSSKEDSRKPSPPVPRTLSSVSPTTPSPHRSSSTVLAPASAMAPTVKMSKTSPPSPIAALKAPPMIGHSIYEQLQRHFPNSVDNPLALLASKAALFPGVLGATGPVHPQPAHPQAAVHAHPTLSLPEASLSLQNALALAQSRAVMERLTSSQQHQLPRGLLGHQQHTNTQSSHHHHHHHHHHAQPSHPHQANAQQPPPPATIPAALPLSERPISFQNALALAQSRVLLERVGTSQILSPVMPIDNGVNPGYGRKLFPCPQCRYTTDRRNNLKRHMLTMHQTSSKMLECCGILFSTKASLREHAMIFHYHGYTCYFCGRRFCRKALLKRHLSVHNGQKDFVCNVCDYATSHKSNLERHRKVHSRQDDGKDGENPEHYHDEDTHHFHDDVKSNGSEAVSHDDVSSDDLSVCSDYDDDIDVEINVHSD